MKLFRLLLLLLLLLLPGTASAQSAGWIFPTGATYGAQATDNGKILSSENAPGTFTTVTLPNPSAVGAGWLMGFSEANGRGVIVNAPTGHYILSGQKTLTSYASPSNTNYEYYALESDGTNFRILVATAATELYNGTVGQSGSWIYLYNIGHASQLTDNGYNFSSAFAGGAVSFILPSSPLLPNGWSVGLYTDGGNTITISLNSTQGGTLIDPFGKSVSSYTLSATPSNVYALLSFDGANFRLVLVTNPVVMNSGWTGSGPVVLQNNAVINTPTVAGGTFNSPAINTPSITGGTATTLTMNNSTINSSTFNGGAIYPTLETHGISFGVSTTTGCSRLYNLAASGGGQAVTFSSASSYPGSCQVRIVNNDSRAWTIAGVGGASFFQWPNQVCEYQNMGNSWRSNCPQRYLYPGGTFYVSTLGFCSDSNDGLAPVTNSQLCHVNSAINLIHNSIDNGGGVPTIQLAASRLYVECIDNAGYITGGGDQIAIRGDINNPTNYLITGCGSAGNSAVSAEDYGILTLQGIEIACNGGPAVFSRQFGVVDLFSVEIGSCDGQTMIDVENGGHVNITGNLFVAGNAAAFVISRGESAQFLAGTVTINGSANLNIGYFVDIDGHSQADFSAAGLQFTGFGNLIGTKFIAANLGELRTGGRCSTGSPGSSTFLPGSSGGSLLNGAICD